MRTCALFIFVIINFLILTSCQQEVVVKEKPKSLTIDFAAGLGGEEEKSKIVGLNWDYENPVFVASGAYPRLLSYENKILCFYENNGIISMKIGDGEAKSWGEPIKVAEYKQGAAITPGPLLLKNGDILCFYVDSPLEDFKDYFRIMVTRSTDQGKTWSVSKKLFQAGNNFKAGCWEPSACQVKSGEIYLFFSNELPYGDSNEQEVTMLLSEDNGEKWSKPEKLLAKETRRFGAPSALTLKDDEGMLLVVDEAPEEQTHEKNKALVLYSTTEDKWERPLTKKNETVWGPFISTLDKETYAASPSISYLSSGETVLSVSYNEGDRKEPSIAVFIGDKEGKFFTHKSEPFQIASEVKAHLSSVYVFGDDKVAVAATTTLNEKTGIWISFGDLRVE